MQGHRPLPKPVRSSSKDNPAIAPSPAAFAAPSPKPAPSFTLAAPQVAPETSDDARSTSYSRSDTSSLASISSRVPFPPEDVPPVQAPHAPVSVTVEPLPDSLLCRSTFAALEHSAGTLKRLSKHVLDHSSEVLGLLEQVEKAEDEMLAVLGTLGRWLENGYGVKGEVWEDTVGMRKVAREKRRRQREELEVMVVHAVEAVKGEIKRQGLAGNGAQSRFENTSKQYYAATAAYLSGEREVSGGEQAQAARQAQFDLLRYNHHSTLLYAVPPSSVGCLDLLVGLYGWVGAVLSQSPGKRADTHPPLLEEDFARRAANATGGAETPTQRGRALAVSETPVRLLLRDDDSVRGSHEALSRTLSLSLAHLVNVRGDLLRGWAARDEQTTQLEETSKRLQDMAITGSAPQHQYQVSASVPDTPMTPTASSGREKPKKRIGGKIRGLFSSSSSVATPALAERAPPVSSSNLAALTSRKSVDVSKVASAGISHISDPRLISTTSSQGKSSERAAVQATIGDTTSAFPMPPLRPVRADGRHSVDVRRSIPIPGGRGPFVAADEAMPTPSTPSSRAKVLADTAAKLNGVQVGGVGGLDGTEDEQREQVGRKKEGVLWGTGSWEALDRDPGRTKWERFWVVLANSSLYEHRDAPPGKPEASPTTIDLKFASVREGRGTDRRFVFEVVTPSHGRRLYQATSEVEMRTWIYTICNAIESCINGTSTVRSSDRRPAEDSGSVSVGNIGEGIGAMSIKDRRKSTGSKKKPTRQSIGALGIVPPPPPRGEEPRKRRTSLKSRLKQGAEAAGDRLSTVVGAKRSSVDFERLAFLAPAARMPSYNASSSTSASRRASWYSEDDIERRVLEMAGVEAASQRTSSSRPGTAPSGSGRTRSDASATRGCLAVVEPARRPSPSPALEASEALCMADLHSLAATGANTRCADCGRATKTSRWATLSLREVPMVMFLCIRCVGLHRGLGTHISKPRSVDLDNWSPDAILLAHQWGNERANGVWEALKPAGHVPGDDDVADYIQAKYVEGRWLADGDRLRFGLAVRSLTG
ncbi:uncharacterized protein CcaverHIS019_0204130 [Cutaneotrichosporon cavernicola]|uniref:ArfGap-domain-containing protein n=1 Tax=Cutaneotrichosporon cavernicola TaxID=279322 RepID=A0AA48I0U9_9TREE|nr:uncharacterized protein CcaverHIS019_0204130 [Cutaneotrichosporon cavernicola]BEI89051.1 hypothetical protein CcaverHIS019_0204130 [Cutaneotrichosporon cavernicola]BEI96826.1 hypothetical protein CcaverHIS631_0204150 [Cutaneotrichosporon cavernicola]BEJ04598.1 hypothetical protein CcaverHIS641_0204150 [Cutaneotrichosporon cavernicola]